jgi:hypothetical protein
MPMNCSAEPRLIGNTYTPPAGFELGQPEPVQLGDIWFWVGGRRLTPDTTSLRQLTCSSHWLLRRIAAGCCDIPLMTELIVLLSSASNAAMSVTC